MNNVSWYKDWFNSPYYHLLYNKRNENEATFFIDNLYAFLKLNPGSYVWDIACGKGRHALAFCNKGCHATGTDLSENSIEEALLHKNNNLEFFIHDMRRPFRINYFDCAVNLFTSIGYFKNNKDNFAVFKNVFHALKPGGIFVVDFLNSNWIKSHIQPCGNDYCEERNEVTFKINKVIENETIHKKITFSDKGHNFEFEETVSLLTINDFKAFAEAAHLKLENTFGDYNLNPFNETSSERLILIFRK